MLGIYEIARPRPAWDMAVMAKSPDKKKEASAYAAALVDRLVAHKPALLSENDWCDQAGVSRSFFSNMRGTPTKPPSVPSVLNLRAVLDVAHVSLSEFFLPEAGGKLAKAPNEQALEQALRSALVALPKKPADRLPYLLEAVRGALALPPARLATSASEAKKAAADDAATAPPLAATR